jgi:serine/threonine protein kinase
MKLEANTLIDKHYRLIRSLGSGGFSEVWLAEKIQVNSLHVALKIFYSENATKEERERFIRKFEMVFNLRHSNLLPYYDCNEDNGRLYFVMPWCKRGSVASQAGTMSEAEAWRFLTDVSAGLAYLHQNDIIHQDIKPDNVLLSDDDAYLITDFDISVKAKNTRRMGDETPAGTAGYMAPERFGAMTAPIQASDVWGLGASLFELLTGKLPFGENGGLYQKSGAPMPTVNRAIHPALQNIIRLCLQTDPWDRPTAGEINGWCRTFSANGKIVFPTKYRQKTKDIPWEKEKKEDNRLEKQRERAKRFKNAKKIATRLGIVILTVVVSAGIFTGILINLINAGKAKRQEKERMETIQRQQEENERKNKISDCLRRGNAAFNSEPRDYDTAFLFYLEAKNLGSDDTSGYSNFKNIAQELIEIYDGKYEESICGLLQKAQQLNNTEEIRRMLNNCR